MSEHDRDWDEMDPSELTHADWELSGRGQDGLGNEELVRFVGELRALYKERPSEPIERAHIVAIAEEAERTAARDQERTSLAGQPEPPSKRRRAIPRKRLVLLAAAALGVALLAAGLASAGVRLPGVVRAPLDQLGVQPPSEASADSVTQVIDPTAPGRRECSFGQPIAAPANRGAQGTAGALCSRQDTNTGGQDGRGGSAARSFGQEPSESARGSALPGERVFGQQTYAAAPGLDQGRPPMGGSQSQPGQQIAPQQPHGGQQVGQQQSQPAQAIGLEQPHGAQMGQQPSSPGQGGEHQSHAGQQVGQQHSQPAQAIGLGQPHGAQMGQQPSSPGQGGEHQSHAGQQVGQQHSQPAQAIGLGQPHGAQMGQPSPSGPQIGQQQGQATGATSEEGPQATQTG